jgi:hypothetical protein
MKTIMQLTTLGAQAAMLGTTEKQILANRLISGENINPYTNGVCYDTVAYVRYLLNAQITPDELTLLQGQDWRNKFNFTHGVKWLGMTPIPTGTAVGFFRLIDRTVFHAALGVGGSFIRAVNGGKLGAGWQNVNLKNVLGTANQDGAFEYDGTKIYVYLSRL